MNKFAIPAMLVATVLVAGAFSFAPVEKASTVHTSAAIRNNNPSLGNIGVTTDTDLKSNATAGCGTGNNGIVHYVVSNTTLVDGNEVILEISNDGETATVEQFVSLNGTQEGSVQQASGTIGITGSTAEDFIIGFDGGTQDAADVTLTVQCTAGGSPSTTP